MRTKGALVRGVDQPWHIEDIDVGDPRRGEVQVRIAASGVCHTDAHLANGDFPIAYPVLGGHEGAGIVTKVGPEVHGLAEGDHVVLSFIPACGRCLPCSRGQQYLCDKGADALTGHSISDGSFRVHTAGSTGRQEVVPMCLLGTFAPYVTVHEASCVKIENDIPLDKAALVGCGVATGWGSATATAQVQPGETVVVIGIGGVGINAVQGAAAAGARRIIAIDPVRFKREQALRFGATHTFETADKALEPVADLTWGQLADKVIITVGQLTGEDPMHALALAGKGGTVVVTAMGKITDIDVKLSLFELTLFQKTLKGAIFGGLNPRSDIPKLLGLYRDGKLKLDELVTTTYRHEDVNEALADMWAGRNIRGMIVYTDADY